MDKKIFFTFHIAIILLSVWLVALEFFSLESGILKIYTQESGFFELGSGFLLFAFGLFLLVKGRIFPRKIKLTLFAIGAIFILGAMEELSWGQHLLGYKSIEVVSQYNNQNEMNFHNLIPNWFFGLIINLSFYIFFVYIPILIYFYKDKIVQTKYVKYEQYLNYFPSLELVLVFLFAFTLQKYFILDTLSDTIALVVALMLLSIVASQKKELFFTVHLVVLALITGFFMFAHEVFSYQNLQYEIREFVLIYTLVFWIFGIVKSLELKEEKTK